MSCHLRRLPQQVRRGHWEGKQTVAVDPQVETPPAHLAHRGGGPRLSPLEWPLDAPGRERGLTGQLHKAVTNGENSTPGPSPLIASPGWRVGIALRGDGVGPCTGGGCSPGLSLLLCEGLTHEQVPVLVRPERVSRQRGCCPFRFQSSCRTQEVEGGFPAPHQQPFGPTCPGRRGDMSAFLRVPVSPRAFCWVLPPCAWGRVWRRQPRHTPAAGRRPPSRSGLLPPQDLSRRLPVAPAPGRASFAYRVQTGHRFWDISTTKPTKASVPGSTLHLLGAP